MARDPESFSTRRQNPANVSFRLCMANSKIREHSLPCRDLDSIRRCAIWPSCFCICWRPLSGSPLPAAPARLWPSLCSQAPAPDPHRSRKRSLNFRSSDRVVAASSADSRKVSAAFLVESADEAGTQRAQPEGYRRRRRHEKRNPSWGCPRIAQQITLAFGVPINKDVVRRILAVRYRPKPDSGGRPG